MYWLFCVTLFCLEVVLRYLPTLSGSKLNQVGTLFDAFFHFLNSLLERKDKLPKIFNKFKKLVKLSTDNSFGRLPMLV